MCASSKEEIEKLLFSFFTHMSLFPFPFLPNIWRKRYLFFTLHFFFFYRNFPSFIYSAFLSSLYFPLFLHQLLVNYHNIICYPTNTIYFGFLALNRKKVIRAARNNILLGGSWISIAFKPNIKQTLIRVNLGLGRADDKAHDWFVYVQKDFSYGRSLYKY